MYSKHALNDNHSTLGQRLRVEMKKRGITSAELAKRADVKTSFLYDVMSGKSANPSSVKLARVAESLGVSLTYLAGTSDSPDGYQFSLSSEQQDYVFVPHLRAENGKVTSFEDAADSYRFRRDWISKTIGIKPEDLRMLTLSGDNMHPTLCHGDKLLVDTTQKHPSPPGLFVLFDGAGLVVKRLEMFFSGDAQRVRLICDNAKYSVYESLLEDASIIGRVVWFSREI